MRGEEEMNNLDELDNKSDGSVKCKDDASRKSFSRFCGQLLLYYVLMRKQVISGRIK